MLTVLIKFSFLVFVFGGIYASPHPEFDQPSELLELYQGSYERIWCNASGEEPITYKWFTDDADEISSNYSRTLYSNTTSRGSYLVFDPVTLLPNNNNNNSTFSCTATNKHGLRNKLFFVKILNTTRYNETVEPTFDTWYEEVYVEEGDNVSVWCNASGKGEVLYAWFRGNRQFKLKHEGTNVRVHVRYLREGAFLVFDGIGLNDTGVYHCIASNNYGNASKKYYIHVGSNDTRNVTYDDIEFGLVGVTDTSVTLWVTPLNNTDFVVNYQDAFEKNIWSKSFYINNNKMSEIEIQNLIPSGRYTFWLSFNSSYNSTPYGSPSLEVVLLPPAPEIIFKAIGGGQIEIEWETGSRWANFNRKTIDKHVLSYRWASNPSSGWQVYNCSIDITIPDCQPNSYTIANLSPKSYYEISLRAHTSAGYGQDTKQKIRLDLGCC